MSANDDAKSFWAPERAEELRGNHPGFYAGYWYNPLGYATVQAGSAPGVNSIRLLPFWLPKPMTIQALAARVSTADAGGGVFFDLAIYGSVFDRATTGRFLPSGPALASANGLSPASAGMVSGALASNVTLPIGLYWMAVNTSSASVAFSCPLAGAAIATYLIGTGLSSVISANATTAWIQTAAQTYGTWPDLAGATLGSTAGNTSAIVCLEGA